MTPIRAVACDFFGTLVDLPDPWFRRSAPSALGVSPRAWLAAVREVGLRQPFPTLEHLVHALAVTAGARQPQARELLVAALRHQLGQARLVPGASAVLRFLRRRGLKLAFISRLGREHCSRFASPCLGFSLVLPARANGQNRTRDWGSMVSRA